MIGICKHTKISYAIKTIKKCLYDNENQELILNEIDILKSLDHPHILKIFEYY